MNKYLKIFSAAVCSSLALSFMACGDEGPSFGNEVPVAESVEDLSDCNKKNEDNIVYVEEAGTAYICRDGEWHDVDEEEKVSSSSEYFFDFDKSSSSSKTESSSSKEISSSSVIESSSDVAESSSSEAPGTSSSENIESSSSDIESSSSEEAGPVKLSFEDLEGLIIPSNGVFKVTEKTCRILAANESLAAVFRKLYGTTVDASLQSAMDVLIQKNTEIQNGAEDDGFITINYASENAKKIVAAYESEGFNVVLTFGNDSSYTTDESKMDCSQIQVFCHGVAYDTLLYFCSSPNIIERCNGSTYNPNIQFCANDSLYKKCGISSYNPATEFCDTRDNKIYKYVKIGEQTWMAENLNYDYNLGTSWETNPAENGKLYSFSSIVNNTTKTPEQYKSDPSDYQGICPNGWHLPTKADWNLLQTSLINKYGNDKYREAIVNDESLGFLAKPTSRVYEGEFSTSYHDQTKAVYHVHGLSSDAVDHSAIYISYSSSNSDFDFTSLALSEKGGMAVRCIKNSGL